MCCSDQLSPPPIAVVHADEQAVYAAFLTQRALEADARFGGGACSDAVVADVSTTVIAIADRPEIAAMSEKVRVTGCGRSTTQNINVGRMGGSPPWLVSAGLPGESLANLPLQQSVLPQALTQAHVDIASSCSSYRVGDIYVAARPGDVAFEGHTRGGGNGQFQVSLTPELERLVDSMNLAGAWAEVWPIGFCDKDRAEIVVFIPTTDNQSSRLLFLPVWRVVASDGPGALPAPVTGD